MGTFKHRIARFTLILILIISALSLFFDRALIYAVSKMHGLDISYKGFKNNLFKEFIFRDVKVLDPKRGVGFFSRYANLKPYWRFALSGDLAFEVELRDLRLIKSQPEGFDRYDDLPGLVAIPFKSHWTYKEISSNIRFSKGNIHIDRLKADCDEIRLSFTGDIKNDNRLNSDIVIYFSKALTDKIPEDLSKVVLRDEPDGWKSLAVSLNGDYKSPAIQASGKLFRLNIKGGH